LYALVACNAVGAVRLQRLLREFKLADLQAQGDYIIERSRLAMREALRDWPKGTWRNHMTVDGYDTPLDAARGRDHHRRRHHWSTYAGTSASIARGINVPKAYTDAYTSFGIRCLVGSDVPEQLGLARAHSRGGARRLHRQRAAAAAVAARAAVGQMLPDLVFGALRQARPDRVPAEGAASLWNILALSAASPSKADPTARCAARGASTS
jgi:N-methylhydantoinase B